MKFFKLTWAEIKKILLKPTFYILIGCLFVAIIISSFIFSPTPRKMYDTNISGNSLSSLNTNFNSQNTAVVDGKAYLNKKLDEKFEFVDSFNNQTQIDELNSRVGVIFKSFFYRLEDAINTANYNTKLLTDIYTASGDLLQYFDSIKNSQTAYNYIIKSSDFNNYLSLLRNIRSTLPSTMDDIKALENDRDALINLCKTIWKNFKPSVDNMISACASIKKVVLNDEILTFIQEDFRQDLNNCLQAQSQKIENYYQANLVNENDSKHILEFRELIIDYKATCEIVMQTIDNLVDIERLKTRKESENQYLGFQEMSLYSLNEETNFNLYIIKNQIDYSKALTGINFNKNSGIETNGYDFAYYLVSVASLLLTLIMIYLSCIIFSGERHDGLMRMNLTKPCSRTKLYFAKITALISISFIAHLLLGILFLIIGVCIYGTASGSVLVCVFSAGSAFGVAPFWNFIYKVISLFISNTFYILLTSFIALLFSNPVFSVVVSYLVYIFALITNTLLAKSPFIKFLPFIHTDLSFFFGGGIWGNSFLSSLIYSGANFWLSLCYLIVFSALAIFGSIQIFKRQEL